MNHPDCHNPNCSQHGETTNSLENRSNRRAEALMHIALEMGLGPANSGDAYRTSAAEAQVYMTMALAHLIRMSQNKELALAESLDILRKVVES